MLYHADISYDRLCHFLCSHISGNSVITLEVFLVESFEFILLDASYYYNAIQMLYFNCAALMVYLFQTCNQLEVLVGPVSRQGPFGVGNSETMSKMGFLLPLTVLHHCCYLASGTGSHCVSNLSHAYLNNSPRIP